MLTTTNKKYPTYLTLLTLAMFSSLIPLQAAQKKKNTISTPKHQYPSPSLERKRDVTLYLNQIMDNTDESSKKQATLSKQRRKSEITSRKHQPTSKSGRRITFFPSVLEKKEQEDQSYLNTEDEETKEETRTTKRRKIYTSSTKHRPTSKSTKRTTFATAGRKRAGTVEVNTRGKRTEQAITNSKRRKSHITSFKHLPTVHFVKPTTLASSVELTQDIASHLTRVMDETKTDEPNQAKKIEEKLLSLANFYSEGRNFQNALKQQIHALQGDQKEPLLKKFIAITVEAAKYFQARITSQPSLVEKDDIELLVGVRHPAVTHKKITCQDRCMACFNLRTAPIKQEAYYESTDAKRAFKICLCTCCKNMISGLFISCRCKESYETNPAKSFCRLTKSVCCCFDELFCIQKESNNTHLSLFENNHEQLQCCNLQKVTVDCYNNPLKPTFCYTISFLVLAFTIFYDWYAPFIALNAVKYNPCYNSLLESIATPKSNVEAFNVTNPYDYNFSYTNNIQSQYHTQNILNLTADYARQIATLYNKSAKVYAPYWPEALTIAKANSTKHTFENITKKYIQKFNDTKVVNLHYTGFSNHYTKIDMNFSNPDDIGVRLEIHGEQHPEKRYEVNLWNFPLASYSTDTFVNTVQKSYTETILNQTNILASSGQQPINLTTIYALKNKTKDKIVEKVTDIGTELAYRIRIISAVYPFYKAFTPYIDSGYVASRLPILLTFRNGLSRMSKPPWIIGGIAIWYAADYWPKIPAITVGTMKNVVLTTCAVISPRIYYTPRKARDICTDLTQAKEYMEQTTLRFHEYNNVERSYKKYKPAIYQGIFPPLATNTTYMEKLLNGTILLPGTKILAGKRICDQNFTYNHADNQNAHTTSLPCATVFDCDTYQFNQEIITSQDASWIAHLGWSYIYELITPILLTSLLSIPFDFLYPLARYGGRVMADPNTQVNFKQIKSFLRWGAILTNLGWIIILGNGIYQGAYKWPA